MKTPYRVYLSEKEYNCLKSKALHREISGRGWLSNFLRLIATQEFILINKDTKQLLQILKLKIS